MSEENSWEQQFREWQKSVGFEKEPTALQVFQTIMENREKSKAVFLNDLQIHFDKIDVILQETPSERSND